MSHPSPYQQRRQRLFDRLPVNSVAWIPSGSEQTRNRDTGYPFRAHSDFSYLTGFHEPDAVLVLRKTEDRCESILALRERNPERETWDGIRLGVQQAPQALGIDQAVDIQQLDTHIPEWLTRISSVWMSYEQSASELTRLFTHIGQLKRKIRTGIHAPEQLNDLDLLLHEDRLIKDSDAQQGLIQAGYVTIEGHLSAMQAVAVGAYEYQVQSALEARCKALGAERQAFESIVASGKNACILHYQSNRSQLVDGSLILIDAGAEVAGYAGDCTHTFPINGRFTTQQAALYDLTLEAQQQAMRVALVGSSYQLVHQTAVNVIAQGLIDLGLLTGDLNSVIEAQSYKPFYMHQTSHWLGCDVHDVGRYHQQGDWRTLQSGMALTVEPGIYIAPDNTSVAEEWRGIGIRIEDSVLITDSGQHILTQGLPRSRQEIEAWMRNR